MKKVLLSFVTFALVASAGVSLNAAYGRGTIVEQVRMVDGIEKITYAIGQSEQKGYGKATLDDDTRNLQSTVDRLNTEASLKYENEKKNRDEALAARGLLEKAKSAAATCLQYVRRQPVAPEAAPTSEVLVSKRVDDYKPLANLELVLIQRGRRGQPAAPAAPKHAEIVPPLPLNNRNPNQVKTEAVLKAAAAPGQVPPGGEPAVEKSVLAVAGAVENGGDAADQAAPKADKPAADDQDAQENDAADLATQSFGTKTVVGSTAAVALGLNYAYPTVLPKAWEAATTWGAPRLEAATAWGAAKLATAQTHAMPLASSIATQMANSTPAQIAMNIYASPALPAVAVGGTALAAIYAYYKWVNRKNPTISDGTEGALRNCPPGLLEKIQTYAATSKFFAPARFINRHKGTLAIAALIAFLGYHGVNGWNNYSTATPAPQCAMTSAEETKRWMAAQTVEHGPANSPTAIDYKAAQRWMAAQVTQFGPEYKVPGLVASFIRMFA